VIRLPTKEQAYTKVNKVLTMTIHITNAQSIGSIVVEGKHKQFRALACPLGCISREVNVADDFAKLDCSAIDLPG